MDRVCSNDQKVSYSSRESQGVPQPKATSMVPVCEEPRFEILSSSPSPYGRPSSVSKNLAVRLHSHRMRMAAADIPECHSSRGDKVGESAVVIGVVLMAAGALTLKFGVGAVAMKVGYAMLAGGTAVTLGTSASACEMYAAHTEYSPNDRRDGGVSRDRSVNDQDARGAPDVTETSFDGRTLDLSDRRDVAKADGTVADAAPNDGGVDSGDGAIKDRPVGDGDVTDGSDLGDGSTGDRVVDGSPRDQSDLGDRGIVDQNVDGEPVSDVPLDPSDLSDLGPACAQLDAIIQSLCEAVLRCDPTLDLDDCLKDLRTGGQNEFYVYLGLREQQTTHSVQNGLCNSPTPRYTLDEQAGVICRAALDAVCLDGDGFPVGSYENVSEVFRQDPSSESSCQSVLTEP